MKKKTNYNVKNIIMISAIAVIILVGGILLIKGCNKEEKKQVKKIGASEEDIIKSYNMSKEDAINKVKSIYNGDVYEFSAEINEDSKYIVSVKNIVTEGITKYLVDPTSLNGSFYEIDE